MNAILRRLRRSEVRENRVRPWLWPALAALLAIAASIGGLLNQYVQDDIPIIWQNPAIHDLGGIGALFTKAYWPAPFVPTLYRPFATSFFALQWAAGDGSPMMFRAVSYLLYAAVAVGVFHVARLRLSPFVAFGAAALFAVHPVHVEAVAAAVNQGELWVGLLSCIAVIRYVKLRAGGTPISGRNQLLFAALYLVACPFKETALVLPGFLVAAEALLVSTAESLGTRVARARPLFLLLGLVAVAFYWVRTQVLGGNLLAHFRDENLIGLGVGERALTMLAVVPHWFRLLLWPAHLQADYGASELTAYTTWGVVQTLGLSLLVAVVALAIVARRKAPMVTFGLAWCAIGLIPVHNVFAPTGILLAERTLFLPSIGAMLALGGIGAFLLERSRPRVGMALGVLTGALLVLGIYRSTTRHEIWSDQFTLSYRTAHEDAPKSFRAHDALAETYFNIGVERMAEQEFQLAMRYAPKQVTLPTREYAERLRYRGFCYPATELYRKVLVVHPYHLPARASLIACLLDMGSYREAMFHARVAISYEWEQPAFQLALATADSAARVGAPPGTVRVPLPSTSGIHSSMTIGQSKP